MEVDSQDTNRIINALLVKLTEEEKCREKERKFREKPKLVHFGLREHEAEAWLDQEPNYSRWIFKKHLGDDNLTEPPRPCSAS